MSTTSSRSSGEFGQLVRMTILAAFLIWKFWPHPVRDSARDEILQRAVHQQFSNPEWELETLIPMPGQE